MEMVALILGICSILFCFAPGLGAILGIAAVVVGLKAKGQLKVAGRGDGMALAGQITGALGTVLNVIMTAAILLVWAGAFAFYTAQEEEQRSEMERIEEAQRAQADMERERAAAQHRIQLEQARREEERARAEAAAQEAAALRAAQEAARLESQRGGDQRPRRRGPTQPGDPLSGLEL